RIDIPKDVWADVVTLSRRYIHRTGRDDRECLFAELDVLLDAIERFFIDDRTDGGLGKFGWTDLERQRGLSQFLDDHVVDRFQHDAPRTGGALLASVTESAVGNAQN